jgi:hypothetical protein
MEGNPVDGGNHDARGLSAYCWIPVQFILTYANPKSLLLGIFYRENCHESWHLCE